MLFVNSQNSPCYVAHNLLRVFLSYHLHRLRRHKNHLKSQLLQWFQLYQL